MPERRVPYARQWVDDSDVAAVTDALQSDFLTTGPAVPRFEQALASVTGGRNVVALSSGTAALHAMYFATGVGPNTEVVTSPLTFAATANAARYLGATVRFADVALDTGNLDPVAVSSEITPQTRAVVAVDFAGHPADYDALVDVARPAGAFVLADAAHSLGAESLSRRVGTLARASAFSFHAVKAVTTGEGGAIVTDDDAIAEKARGFRTHGVVRDPAAAERIGGWYYEQVDLGFNYRLTDVQAALGTSQLRRLEAFIARRRSIAARYQDALASVPGLELPGVRAGISPAWHLYVVRVREALRRRALFERLHALGIGVQVHYIPVYLQPYYKQLGYRPGLCPVAEDIYSRSISLPMFPRLDDADLDSVIERVLVAARDVL